MKLKRTVCILLITVMVLSLVACNRSSTATTPNAGTNPTVQYNWKLGHGLAPDHPYHKTALEFARLCKEASNGAINIEVFPSAQLGGEREMYESVQMGTLDFTASTTSPLVNFDPSFSIFDMPFLFDDKEHAYRVLDGEIGQKKLDNLEKFGMVGLTFWECGLFNFVYSGEPILKPDDLKGRTIRTMESKVTMSWVKSLGANPVPMAWSEVFTAIQNGTVDGTILPITTTYFNKIYTVGKNYSMLNLTYAPLPLTMSKKVWDPLPDNIKAIIKDAAVKAREYNREYTASVEEDALNKMKADGASIFTFTPEERQDWVNVITKEAYPQLIPSMFTQEEVDSIRALK